MQGCPHTLSDADRACPECGELLTEWKGETEDSERAICRIHSEEVRSSRRPLQGLLNRNAVPRLVPSEIAEELGGSLTDIGEYVIHALGLERLNEQ